ncbi:putative exported protein [Marinobacterium lacunae]|uniref:Putative exported protein n=2 Tax=Marinobacterium lacunae TaxID=1232683 RepID=A0A081FT43_9GAMM|nr:putative exported protein [Marinobacterium lacunae]
MFKRYLRYALLVLLVLLLLILSVLGWSVATESGTRWLAGRAIAYAPGSLRIETVSGRLIDQMQLTGIHYQAGDLAIDGESLLLEWDASGLLSGELLIRQLVIGPVDLHLPKPTDEAVQTEGSDGIELPGQVTLPLGVEIRDLRLARVRVFSADNDKPETLVDNAELILSARGESVELERLSVQSPMADLSVNGRADLRDDYPLGVDTQWVLRVPRGGVDDGAVMNVSGKGRISGDLKALVIEQQVQGAVTASLKGQLEQVLSAQPQWQAELAVSQVEISQILTDPTQEMQALDPEARITAKGDLSSAEVELSLFATLPELKRTQLDLGLSASTQRIEIERLTLTPEQGEARLEGVGRIDDPLGARTLKAKLSWQALRYPLVDTALVRSAKGELSLDGSLDDYRLTLTTGLNGPDFPPIELNLQAQGSLEGIRLEPLHAETLGGKVDIEGNIGWQSQLDWNLNLSADQLDPGQFWPQLPGSVSTQLHSSGQLAEQLEAELQIKRLDGNLQSQPLKGGGVARMMGPVVRLDQLNLEWGGTQLTASGEIAEQMALQWTLNVADLGRLLPGSQGRIKGAGRLSGARALPSVDADIDVAGLRVEGAQLDRLDGRVRFDPNWRQPADIHIEAKGIEAGGQQIQSAVLNIDGTDKALNIALDAQAKGLADLALRADGRLQTDLQKTPVNWQWAGRITRLDIDNPHAGHWGLKSAATIAASPKGYELSRLCLIPQAIEGAACLEGRSQGADTEARLDVQSLSLALLEPFIPDPTRISGIVNAEARFSARGQRRQYEAQVLLPSAGLSLPDSDLNLTLDRSRVTVSGDEKSAQAKIDLRLDPFDGVVRGQLDVSDLSGAQRLRGGIEARLEQLRPLSLLVPTLQIQQGTANAQLKVAGTLAEPDITGQLSVAEGDIEVPSAGIRVTNIQLKVEDDPQHPGQMRVNAQARSGEGELAVKGRVQPAEQLAELQISGAGFEAVNTAQVQVLVSPDLQLALSPARIKVRGDLTIPEALIQTPKIEQSAVSASPDLVVQDATGAQAARGPELDVDLRVEFGDAVRVDAFGFDGRLAGALNLQQQGQGLARGTGSVGVVSGQYRLYGQDLNISRGNVVFTGGPLSNPGLDLRVEREVDDVVVGALVSGTLRKPDLRLTSSPAMPDNRILSYLVLGRAPDSASAGEQQMLMKLALSLGAKGGTSITEKIGQSLNVDEIGFASGETADETSFYIGKYLSPDLYIKYGLGLINPVNTFLMRYQLSKRLSLETETSSEGSGGDLIYSFER